MIGALIDVTPVSEVVSEVSNQQNAFSVAAYKSAQNSVSFNQQQITDLRAKLDKETGRLNNEKARNGELKRRLKQLKAGN